MSQLDRTAESLEDILISLNNEWRTAQDSWLDANRTEFESLFFTEIDKTIRTALNDFQNFSEAVERAKQHLER